MILAASFAAFFPSALQALDDPREIVPSLRGDISLASGDLDEDGRLDLVFASRGQERILWLKGREDSTVASGLREAARQLGRVRALEVADVDLDGHLDILAVTGLESDIQWLRGDGLGHFETVILAEDLGTLGVRIYAIDHDEDGDLDIIAMRDPGGGGSLGPVLLDGRGAGAFDPPTALFQLDESYTDLVQFDVDGDGLRDLVLSGSTDPTSWFRQPAAPGMPWVRTDFSFNVFDREWDLKAADLDGDGDLDLAGTGFRDYRLHFYENLGGGSFGPQISLGPATGEREDLAVVDVDLDGDLDVVLTRSRSEGPVWLENQGSFQFLDRGEFLDPGTATGTSLHARDMNGDGFVDLVFGATAASLYQVFGSPGSGSGLAFDPTPVRIGSTVRSLGGVAALDVNGDAIPDVVTASAQDGLEWSVGLGASRFDAVRPLVTMPPSAPLVDATELQAADLDGDGLDDLVVRLGNGDVAWLRIGGAGAEAPALLGSTGSSPVGPLLVRDFDGDGDRDLLFIDDLRNEVRAMEQIGAGQFAPPVTIGIGPAPINEIAVADLGGDGTADIVIAAGEPGDGSIGVLTGLWGGAFQVYALVLQESEILGLIPGDVDGDGDVDLSWFRQSTRLLIKATNHGAGAFGAVEVLGGMESRPRAIVEGPPGPSGGPTAVVFSSQGTAASRIVEWIDLTASEVVVIADSRVDFGLPVSLSVTQVTGDGDLDVLAAGLQAKQVVWLENRERAELGSSYCGPAVRNSTGVPSRIGARGIDAAAENAFSLDAIDLPPLSTTLFLVSRDAGFVPMPAGSLGTLCLGGAVGRFARSGEPGQASTAGFFSLDVDLANVPQPQASVSALAGETWRFQAWYRDAAGGIGVSNFTDGVEVSLR